jgi:hypothetical protein
MAATSIVGERSGSGGRFGCARRYLNALCWMDREIGWGVSHHLLFRPPKVCELTRIFPR